ncbi:hypothetical protein BV22DRAFT_1134836 [Leucogyrophana mollusca]|uniref:Uncharacterized protein n=1 Tax=Leucogyrophana mollusca TaxID=85980 RepID=A0ACB8AZ36_9AGAM|nr:hypothetical protein BV22DRAFT_1134836 [Leucogyrophana mollusca]
MASKKGKHKRKSATPEPPDPIAGPPKTKKQKSQAKAPASTLTPDDGLRRSSRSGAGAGGRITQLERISDILEGNTRAEKQRVFVADDAPRNPQAPAKPPPKQRGAKKGSKTSAKDSSSKPTMGSKASCSKKDAAVVPSVSAPLAPSAPSIPAPVFHRRDTQSHFGFFAPDAHVVPPGTEPDLQALNNPYIAAQRSDNSSANKSKGSSLHCAPSYASSFTTTQSSDTSTSQTQGNPNPFPPNRHQPHATQLNTDTHTSTIDPALRSTINQVVSDDSSGSEDEREGESRSSEEDEGDDEDEDEEGEGEHGDLAGKEFRLAETRAGGSHTIQRGFVFEQQQPEDQRQEPHHIDLPPDNEFEYSRDEADAQAATNLWGEEEPQEDTEIDNTPDNGTRAPDDVLSRHHAKNRPPRLPNPITLNSIRNSTLDYQDSSSDNEVHVRPPRRSRTSKSDGPNPKRLGYYPPRWKDLLEDTKDECRTIHALENPFPTRLADLHGSITESLMSVVYAWDQRQERLEPDIWPLHKPDMAVLLLEDMSTWRSDLKKTCIMLVPNFYALFPPPGNNLSDEEHLRFTKDAAAKYREDGQFLHNGVDELGKTQNLANPALFEAAVTFFYTGSYSIARKRPEIFRHSLPYYCLALVGTAYNCVLDGFAKHGPNKKFPDFSGKTYSSLFLAMVAIIEQTAAHPYHGPKLVARMKAWGAAGWAQANQTESVTDGHSHLRVFLD